MNERSALLRWAGSKRRSVKHLLPFIRAGSGVFNEPFAGSAVMLFAHRPEQSRISDLNSSLMNFYYWVKKEPLEVYARAKIMRREKSDYLAARSRFNPAGKTMHDAILFYYLNLNCFNGIYRTNQSGKFNVPFSGSKTPNIPDQNEFLRLVRILDKAEIKTCDFRQAISENLTNDQFFYLDPPYYTDERRVFREYGPTHFSKYDLFDLIDLLDDIDASGSQFVISYADTYEARCLLAKWNTSSFPLIRSVGGSKNSRKIHNELIAQNFELPQNKGLLI